MFSYRSKCGQWFTGFVVASCGFISGLGLVWAAVLFAKLESGEINLEASNLEKSFIASFIHIGQIISVIPGSFVQDKMGRRSALIIAINFAIAAWFLILFEQQVWAILVARIMFGIWSSFVVSCCPPYLSETAVARARGRVSAMLTALAILGCLYQSVIGDLFSYNVIAILSLTITLTQLCLLIIIPESVYSLLRRGKHSAAERNLKWIRGSPDVSDELRRITKYMNIQMARKSGFKDIFTWPASRKAFTQSVCLVIIQRTSGFQALLSFSPLIVPSGLFDPRHFPWIWMSVNLTFVMISIACTDRVDRKVLLFISCAGTSFFYLIVMTWFLLNEKTEMDMSDTRWLPVAATLFATSFYSLGLTYIPMLFQGEVFPINIKSKANSLIALTGYIMSVIIVQIFLPLKVYVGMFSNFLLYALSASAGCYMSLHIIETRNRTLETIQKILEGRPEDSISDPSAAQIRSK